MQPNQFEKKAMVEGNTRWDNAISRRELYSRPDEIRSPFARDYTRILHSTAYRRLKHKTQVFFATTNDHICTRIEHVNHVNSVSKTISNYLGLNTELTDAISIGHDIGHAPFGHEGENTLKKIIEANFPELDFWHEKNSLRFADLIETLEGPDGEHYNLNLSYAVRDGIICHCGEVDENGLMPREQFIDLWEIKKAGQVQPYTWEGCVVKISDKIAYLGRDIEDALTLKILENEQLDELDEILHAYGVRDSMRLNNTVLIHSFIIDLCENSSPEDGITFSDNKLMLMKDVKDFCYRYIYKHPKVEVYKRFVNHIIRELYEILAAIIKEKGGDGGGSNSKKYYPDLYRDFLEYLTKYSLGFEGNEGSSKVDKLYDLTNDEDQCIACIVQR